MTVSITVRIANKHTDKYIKLTEIDGCNGTGHEQCYTKICQFKRTNEQYQKIKNKYICIKKTE